MERLLQIISEHLAQWNEEKAPAELYKPITYTLSLGGKRVRPLLCLLGCELFSDDVLAAMPPALAIEMFHNFTLLHDDIMDKADLRRGQPTVHKLWNENTAILSGDVMQVKAFQWLARVKEPLFKPLFAVLAQTAIEVCEGQQYDMEFETRSEATQDEYLEMIRLKTAVLLGAALKMGSLVGGASEVDAQALYRFGENIGLAFQLKDDLLDTFGNEATFGKKIGGDILCNKKTYLLIHALERAQGDTRKELDRWLAATDFDPQAKIFAVTRIYEQSGVKFLCEQKMNEYEQIAFRELAQVQVAPERKAKLQTLAETLMSRET